jgi:hypothetical protein
LRSHSRRSASDSPARRRITSGAPFKNAAVPSGPSTTTRICRVVLSNGSTVRRGRAAHNAATSAPTALSSGIDSPVRIDSSTITPRASISRPSAGTRSPASIRTTSPGTRSRPGRRTSRPSRTTHTTGAASARKRSIAACALVSCHTPRPALSRRIAAIASASAGTSRAPSPIQMPRSSTSASSSR